MKIVTWNVNSLKVRLEQVQNWLTDNQPDVLCLQETKTEDVNFPLEALQQAGYHVVFSGQKTYNGVAIISKDTPSAEYTLEHARVACTARTLEEGEHKLLEGSLSSGIGPAT